MTSHTMVCGFALTSFGSVVLIEKESAWWIGVKHNGIGGKVYPGEGFRAAQRRHFFAATGIDTDVNHWYGFHHERWRNGNEVYYFTTLLDDEKAAQVFDTLDLKVLSGHAIPPEDDCAPGVPYLIPMAQAYMKAPVYLRPL